MLEIQITVQEKPRWCAFAPSHQEIDYVGNSANGPFMSEQDGEPGPVDMVLAGNDG